MTQQTPAPGDVFIDERKRMYYPKRSWLYYLIREDPKPIRDTGWLAIYGPGTSAGIVTHVGTARLNTMTFLGVVGDRIFIPPQQEK